jgi:hypothetical protein
MILYVILMVYGGLSVLTLSVLLYALARHDNLTRRDERRAPTKKKGEGAVGSKPSSSNEI